MKLSNAVKRIWYHNKNNSPFLSGDVFADLADVSVYPPKLRSKNPSRSEISNAKIIFCPSGKIEEFLNDYGRNLVASILIFGNGDDDFYSFDYKIPKTVKRIYLQNSMISDSRFSCLPIGIENIRLIRNGFPKLYMNPKNLNAVNKIMLGPFSNTHPERNEFETRKYSSHYVDRYFHMLEPKYFDKTSRNYNYMICPRGNGIDTHRFWECLYKGVIPIVKDSQWVKSIDYLNLNFRVVNEWSESELIEIVNDDKSNLCTVSDNLWISSWIERFKKEI